jgi:hypothetical protein
MSWQHICIKRFGGPEVLELAEQPTIPEPGPDEVRIRIFAAGTGFTDSFIRRGRYPDFKGPLPFTPAGVDAAFDAIGGAHFNRSYACLASGGLLVGYGSQAMAVGREGLASAALGLARLNLWGALSFLFGGRRALFYNITARRLTHPEEFKAAARRCNSSSRHRPTAARCRERGPYPHRCRRARRQDRTATVARVSDESHHDHREIAGHSRRFCQVRDTCSLPRIATE